MGQNRDVAQTNQGVPTSVAAKTVRLGTGQRGEEDIGKKQAEIAERPPGASLWE